MNLKEKFLCCQSILAIFRLKFSSDNSRYQLIRQIVFCVVSYFSLSVGITFYNQQVMHVSNFIYYCNNSIL